MADKLIAEWKPERKTRLDDVQSLLGAERADSWVTARKTRQEIVSKGNIDNAFDGISYSKGAAVNGMFERWIGPGLFQKGVRAYLERYAFSKTIWCRKICCLITNGTCSPTSKRARARLNRKGRRERSHPAVAARSGERC